MPNTKYRRQKGGGEKDNELVHAIIKAKKTEDLQMAIWRSKWTDGINISFNLKAEDRSPNLYSNAGKVHSYYSDFSFY